MKRTSISPGVYVDAAGVYWARPTIRGRRTWRTLKAVKAREAVRENANTDWNTPANAFRELAQLYLEAGCPNKRLEPRPASFTTPETARVKLLIQFFGPVPAESLRIADVPRYRAWRLKRLRYGRGDRTVDKDIQTLSNVLNYGVATNAIPFNYLRAGRPRYQREQNTRHSREVAPASADQIHTLARELLSSVRSESLGWQLLFAMFTGCRTSELLRLRLDARNPETAGFISWNAPGEDGQPAGPVLGHLFLKRSKRGVNPWALIGAEFKSCLAAFRRWHRERHANSTWYFPGQNPAQPVNAGALGHALTRLCRDFNWHTITPHGLRSYYVTKRRSDGAADAVIAGEIGDKTVALMQTTYGDRPANWTGGQKLDWLPSQGLPAWQTWLPQPRPEKLDSKLDYARKEPRKFRRQVVAEVVAGDGIEPPTQGFSVIS